jgi:hypothetical protein
MQFNKKWLYVLIGLPAVMIFMAFFIGRGTDLDVKNRVPTMQAQLDQVQQAARDAKASENRTAQIEKNIQAAIDKLDSEGRNSDGSVRVGHPEVTGTGTVTEVGGIKVSNGDSENYFLWFTFAEKAGFTTRSSTLSALTKSSRSTRPSS